MTEFSPKIESFYKENLRYLRKFKRPQIRSLAVSLIATLHERKHETEKAIATWTVSNAFLEDAVNANPENAFEFAVDAITLTSKPDNEKYEYLRKYLVGNGLTILVHDKTHAFLVDYLETGEKKAELAQAIKQSQLFNVTGWDASKAFSNPEGFNLFAAVTVGCTLSNEPGELAKGLAATAKARLQDDSARKIIDMFMPSPDSKPIAIKLVSYLG